MGGPPRSRAVRRGKNKYGRTKKIPVEQTWHHKSCGQCGHIPGYSTSVFWINRKLGLDYHDPTDQTSCTAWNYYASATSNAAAQAAVAMRNFAAAHETGYYPIIHCATSFGHYKETRQQLIHHPELRRQVRDILAKLGKKLIMPEEIVHYSEWVHAVRDRIAEHQVIDMSHIAATIHPACHYHKLIGEDASTRPRSTAPSARRSSPSTLQALGIDVRDYSTWSRLLWLRLPAHPGVARLLALVRRAAQDRGDEGGGRPDVLITHDTGCVTTLDQSQFAAKAHNRNVGLPVMSDSQLAALAMGAHPYKVLQLHWHSTDNKPFLEKLGVDHEKAWAEFEAAVEQLKSGEKQYLTWEDCDA